MCMEMKKLIESLSPNEKKILPHLNGNVKEIIRKTNLDQVSVLRALEYLQNKEIVKLNYKTKKIIDVGVNGSLYKTKGLPERRLLNLLGEKRIVPLKDAAKLSKISEDEFKASLGVLKKKALIDLKNRNIMFTGNKSEISKKSLEELFLESLPLNYDLLEPEQAHALKSLESRRNIIEIKEAKTIGMEVTDLGKKVLESKIETKEMIEQLTSALLKKESLWKGKKFRRYDVTSPVPEISGGKRHFVNQAIDYTREIWTDMGFKEMTGDMVQSSFWNFDALFQPQDHPARDMQDTFFLAPSKNFEKIFRGTPLGVKESQLPDKKIVAKVKKSHEQGTSGSKGWRYEWNPEVAKQMVLRTHTTPLSAIELSKLKKENLPAKFFAIGKCFRNETVDWSHGFEFYQTEGIVIDENATFKHLLGYLKQFYKKMGFEKIRFRPAYFPYTEPSVEVDVFHPTKKVWLELGGAGMFRPEVTIPLLRKHIPVLAWGQGVDRIIMDYYGIKDLRELYKNDLSQLRKMKFWMK